MKRIFITGASSGIGLATSKALLQQGNEVWGTSRDPARLPQQVGFHPIQLDLSEPPTIERAFRTALAEAERIDVLINNAGEGLFGPMELLSLEELEAQFQILVFAHARLMQLAIPAMRAEAGGLIINVTSLASRLPVPFMAAYNAAKAAMASLTFSAQLELPDDLVRIVDLQPADICTSFNDSIRIDSLQALYGPAVARAWRVADENMKHAPPPEMVANRILQLMADPNPPPRVTVGNVFQSRLAPFMFRFLPQRVRILGLKKYYRL